jgi:hypothetical protein
MKKLIAVFLVAWVVNISNAQIKEDLAMSDILFRGGVAAKKLEMELGYQVIRMEFDRIYDTENSYRYLSKNTPYNIYVLGDGHVRRVKLKVYKNVNDEWSLIDSDNDDFMASVDHNPLHDGLYRFTIEVDLNDGYKSADYCLIVAIK